MMIDQDKLVEETKKREALIRKGLTAAGAAIRKQFNPMGLQPSNELCVVFHGIDCRMCNRPKVNWWRRILRWIGGRLR